MNDLAHSLHVLEWIAKNRVEFLPFPTSNSTFMVSLDTDSSEEFIANPVEILLAGRFVNKQGTGKPDRNLRNL